MKIIFVGSEATYCNSNLNCNSNILLELSENKRLLIDCGNDARFGIAELGLNHSNINNIYITHLHGGHVRGLEWIAFARKFDPSCDRSKLFISHDLVKKLWDNVLSGGLSSLQLERATLDTFYDVNPIEGNKFIWEDIEFKLIKTRHAYDNKRLLPCYGLFFEVNGKKIFITSDTRFEPKNFNKLYNDADLIFHDCETKLVPSEVHAHYNELLTLKKEIKSKIWLYHYNNTTLPDAKADGFLGFVTKGQTFEI